MQKNKLAKNSSLLVSFPALCLWFVLMLLSALGGYVAMAGLFLFFLLLFSFVRYWSSKAMDGVSFEVSCAQPRLFPGMDTIIEYKLNNDKLLPLVWLELSQQAAERECLLPDDSFEAYTYLNDDGETVRKIKAYRRGFSLVMGYESISLTSVWYARCRGIYCPGELLLRSGDGFGLTQEEKHYPSQLLPELVVYPKRVAVDTEIFMRQDWDKSYGALGFKEDMSVLRGIRPYNSSDSWKRINWRMAARQPGELSVNYFETVQPATAMFILDGESYCSDEEALEQTLEIMASLIEQLCFKSVSCGLCLPHSARFTALNFPPRQLGSGELLYYLAGYDCLKDPVLDKDGKATGVYKPSAFVLPELGAAATEAGTVALFTNKPSALSPRLLERVERSRLIVFSSSELNCPDKEIKQLHISALRKGAGL